jgi:hypothetical protein
VILYLPLCNTIQHNEKYLIHKYGSYIIICYNFIMKAILLGQIVHINVGQARIQGGLGFKPSPEIFSSNEEKIVLLCVPQHCIAKFCNPSEFFF